MYGKYARNFSCPTERSFFRGLPFLRRRRGKLRDDEEASISYTKLENSPSPVKKKKDTRKIVKKEKPPQQDKNIENKKDTDTEPDPSTEERSSRSKETPQKTRKNILNLKVKHKAKEEEALSVEEIYEKYFRVAETILYERKPKTSTAGLIVNLPKVSDLKTRPDSPLVRDKAYVTYIDGQASMAWGDGEHAKAKLVRAINRNLKK